jgi:LAO/AO transport system kinase
MSEKNYKPEWTPDNAGNEFATSVMPGIIENSDNLSNQIKKKRKHISTDEFVDGVLSGNITLLSKAITLVESNSHQHIEKIQEVIQRILPKTGNSIRIGITGPPGAGKSTFIEALGMFLCRNNRKVAVLAIDPSSSVSKGSILGDKTRMELLSRQENAYIRPSPSSGTLGGVARKTRETVLLCEAAGFDVILIETIGVGQSEITVRSMVDFFMLLLLPGSGDELQGIKKGVVELADLLIVNKAEDSNKPKAMITKSAYSSALRLLTPATEGWIPKVMTCSALNNEGINDVWSCINDFVINTKSSGVFENRRRQQVVEWIYSLVDEGIRTRFYDNVNIFNKRKEMERKVLNGIITPTYAVNQLLELYDKENFSSNK